jgi:DNA-binding beta-propeller fold protein YncE
VAALTARQIHIFSLPDLAWKAVHSVNFEPVSIAFDAGNRLYATGSQTGNRPVQLDAETGEVLNVFGSTTAPAYLLRTDATGQVLAMGTGTQLDFLDVTQPGIPVTTASFANAGALRDLDIDVAAKTAYLISSNGTVRRYNFQTGIEMTAWPLNQSWGSAVRLAPNGELLGASDYWYGGGIRRYRRTDGAVLGDTVVSTNGGGVMIRGVAVTPNGRAVYIVSRWIGSAGDTSVDGYSYQIGCLGGTINLRVPGPEPFQLELLTTTDPAPGGNGNGYAEPGETIRITPKLANASLAARANVVVRLVGSREDVVPSGHVEEQFPLVNQGVQFSTTLPLTATIGSSMIDGTSLGLSLRVEWDGGGQTIPLPLSAFRARQAFAEVNFQVGALLSNPTRNLCYIIDRTNQRLLALDTASGTVSAVVRLAADPGAGEMALSPDGARVFVALTPHNRIQVLNAATLEPVEVIHLSFSPFSLSIGANAKIYASSSQTWTQLREIDPETGVSRPIGTKNYYGGSLLRTSGDHARLYAAEIGLSGGTTQMYEYSIGTDATPAVTGSYPYYPSNLRDFRLDEDKRRIYLAAGGTYGVQVTQMDQGLSGLLWPFDAPYGAGVAYLPGSRYVYGGSGGPYDGRIRRFDRDTGQPVGDFPIRYGAVPYNTTLVGRGLAVTANDRLFFLSTTSGGGSSGVNGTRYFLNLIGRDQLNMTLPAEKPKIDAGTNLSIKLPRPLVLNPSIAFPGAAGAGMVSWSVVNGPGSAVFSLSGASTEASFSEPGTYRLELTATNEGVLGRDSVLVEVLAEDPKINIEAVPPVLARHPSASGAFRILREGDSSSALTIQLQAGGTLTSGVTHQALPTAVVLPAGVTEISVPVQLLPGAVNGTITLTVLPGSAYEPGVSAAASITMVDSSWQAWADGMLAAYPQADLQPAADPDADGLPNLFEYALGTHPLQRLTQSPFEFGLSDAAHGSRLWLRYRAPKVLPDVGIEAQYSRDLVGWSDHFEGNPAVDVISRQDHGDGTETVTVGVREEIAGRGRDFLRLRAYLRN